MLHPNYFIDQLNTLTELYADLHTAILSSISRHIADTLRATGKPGLMPSTKRQIEAAQAAGLLRDEIASHIARTLSVSVPEIKRVFDDAGVETLRYDNEIYKEAGLPPVIYNQSPTMRRILESRIGKFTASLKRLTGTVAINSEDLFERTLNTAYGKVASGTHSYTEALAEGMDDMLREGVSVFSYSSGRNISIEAAVLMNLRTSVSQAAAEITKQGMIEQGCEYVETSAHMGARNKDVPGKPWANHESWHGKIFHWGDLREEPGFSKNMLQSEADDGTMNTVENELTRENSASTLDRYPVTQEQIDDILRNELKDFEFPVHPTYNPRLRIGYGQTRYESYKGGRIGKITAIEIGKQQSPHRTSLISTLLHEHYEALILTNQKTDNFYLKLHNMTEKDRHSWIERQVSKFFKELREGLR